MTSSSYESEANLGDQSAQHRKRAVPASSSAEAAYERLSAYGFARRYTRGKTVADLIGQHEEEELGGYALGLLAQSAGSVTAALISELPEEASSAASSSLYSSSSSSFAPNVTYRQAELPNLPLAEGHFDVVVAFGVIEGLEHPEELVREAKRVLKEGGVLLISVPDKQTEATYYRDRGGIDGRQRRAMYVPEVRGLLERHFGHVRLYRQGAVAGGFIFPLSKELTSGGAIPLVESLRLSLSGPRLGVEVPRTRSVMGVCSDDVAALGEEAEGAYLLLEGERRVFDESEERAEDVELLLDEIRRMQETEVQAFLKAISAQKLPLDVLLRLIPQVLLYYLYDRQADSQEVSRRWGTVLEKARHRWETTLAETRHRRDVAFAETRHRWETILTQARHRWKTNRAQARHSQETNYAQGRRRRDAVIEEVYHRRNLALAAASHRRNLALAEARSRRDAVIEETRRRRDVALAETRHRRNLALAEVRHRRNVTLEHMIHRRNIIRGNLHAIRQKGARGLAKGAIRRLSVLYRRLREGQKP
jgi:SAM-dependent methyltransferase